jgi:hypothetical protein
MICPASRFIKCINSRAVVDLPQPDIADDPDRFALGNRERHVIHRAHRLALAEEIAAHRKMFCQAIDLQQRLRGAAAIFDRLKHIDRDSCLVHGINSVCPWRCACRR